MTQSGGEREREGRGTKREGQREREIYIYMFVLLQCGSSVDSSRERSVGLLGVSSRTNDIAVGRYYSSSDK